MFYRTRAIFATLKSSSSYVVKSIAVENVSSSTSRRKSSMRLRKVRWNIYQKIRLGDKDMKSVLGYYRSLIKRFLKRFSARMKPREPGIWKEKLSKTVRDVMKSLEEKSTPNSTCEANTIKSKALSQSKPEKKENVPQNAKNVKTHPQQKGTSFTIMAEYMSKMDSALLMLSTVLYLVRNEQTKVKDEPFEVPAVETIDNDLKDVIEAADKPIVTIVTEDEASVKKTVNDDVEEIAEIRTEETAASVMKPVLILTRADYYTIPSTSQLNLDIEGHCLVTGFTVGREGYGNIHFPGTMNVANLNLDDTVFIGHKEVTVFPDDLNKPPLGEGLNRPAQITLDKVWPLDKSSGDTIRSPDKLTHMSFKEKLERANSRTGARFLGYRPETGSWIFKVDHFSKHGLDESDSDTEIVASEMKVKQLGCPHRK